METQVLIIGGGIMGTAVARELSQYRVDVILVERKADIAMGASKCAAGALYSPLDFCWLSSLILKSIAKQTEGTVSTHEAEVMKEKLAIDGAKIWQTLVHELDIDYIEYPHMLVLATSDDDLKKLKVIEEMAQARSIDYTRLSKQDILSLEPHLTKDIIAGLCDYKTRNKRVHPWELVIGLAEVARQNGVKFMLNTEVTGFSKRNGFQIVETTSGPIKTEFIVNATGPNGANVAALADACDFSLQYFKGHTIIGDKNVGGLIHGWIQNVPSPGILRSVDYLPSGNLFVGTTYGDAPDPYASETERASLDELLARGQSLLPELSRKDVIAQFAGTRVFSARDPEEYIVEYAPKNPRFINTIIRLPGVAPSVAIAKNVVGMLDDHGLQLTRKDDFNPYRKRIPQFSKLSDEERKKLIAKDPRYGHVVCRCETITEGEIVEAIKRGATTVDAVKFRTRAGMGRCQGGFCGPRVVEILSRELKICPTEVTKHGNNSRLLLYRAKELSEARKEYAHER
jgi:glycerol-3-phosphate dehydrogenase